MYQKRFSYERCESLCRKLLCSSVFSCWLVKKKSQIHQKRKTPCFYAESARKQYQLLKHSDNSTEHLQYLKTLDVYCTYSLRHHLQHSILKWTGYFSHFTAAEPSLSAVKRNNATTNLQTDHSVLPPSRGMITCIRSRQTE